MSDWETRMAERTALRNRRQQAEANAALSPAERIPIIPTEMRARPAEGMDDTEPRTWCTTCGLPDAPWRDHPYDDIRPCPDCGSLWRWHGRLADLNGTADGPPPPPDGCPDCFRYEPYGPGQSHFGWRWILTCGHCAHDHHKGEVWIA